MAAEPHQAVLAAELSQPLQWGDLSKHQTNGSEEQPLLVEAMVVKAEHMDGEYGRCIMEPIPARPWSPTQPEDGDHHHVDIEVDFDDFDEETDEAEQSMDVEVDDEAGPSHMNLHSGTLPVRTTLRKRARKAIPAQVNALVAYMSQNPHLCLGKFYSKHNKVQNEEEWERLTRILNNVDNGPPKTSKQWRVVWRDLKCAISQKFVAIAKHKLATEKSTQNPPKLSLMEQKVVAVLGMEYEGGRYSATNNEGIHTQRKFGENACNIEAAPEPTLVLLEAESDEVTGIENHVCDGNNFTDEPSTTGQIHNPLETIQMVDVLTDAYQQRTNANSKRPAAPNGAAMENSRKRFCDLLGNQNKSLQLLAESMKQQAEASTVLAQAALKQAENDKLRLEIHSKTLGMLQKLLNRLE